ncbi:MAG: hypothetical protein SFV23_12725 [Planctomycetaceae bacterium]|nr:hypothetical protein [Planctomycetaceae bacterium]
MVSARVTNPRIEYGRVKATLTFDDSSVPEREITFPTGATLDRAVSQVQADLREINANADARVLQAELAKLEATGARITESSVEAS